VSKFNVKVEGIIDVDGNPGVVGTCDDVQFEARPTRWGSKMLMKVCGENTFSQGAKIAIGAAAKKALKTEGKVLPEAILVRPRKAKAPDVEVAPTVEASPTATEAAPDESVDLDAAPDQQADLDELFASA